MTQPTKQQQTYSVSTGLALGLLQEGRDHFQEHSTSVELAFRSAWRAWGPADRFPSVGSMVQGGRFKLHQLTAAHGRKGGDGPVKWAGDGTLQVAAPDVADWNPADAEDVNHVAEHYAQGASGDEWRQLARLLLHRLEATGKEV